MQRPRELADQSRAPAPRRALPDGAKRSRPGPVSARGGLGGGRPPLVAVGRISPEKGTHVLAEAFAALLTEHPAARLELVGPEAPVDPAMLVGLYPGEEVRALSRFYGGAGYLESIMRSVGPGVAARITHTPKVPYDALPAVYGKADLLVSASLAEAFGMPLVEAMSCGLPVIATSAGGQGEIVREMENGLVTAPGDAASLAAAMGLLAGDDARRRQLGIQGRADVLERFSWKRVTDRLLDAYERAGIG